MQETGSTNSWSIRGNEIPASCKIRRGIFLFLLHSFNQRRLNRSVFRHEVSRGLCGRAPHCFVTLVGRQPLHLDYNTKWCCILDTIFVSVFAFFLLLGQKNLLYSRESRTTLSSSSTNRAVGVLAKAIGDGHLPCGSHITLGNERERGRASGQSGNGVGILHPVFHTLRSRVK